MNDIVRVLGQSFHDSRPDELITLEHTRDNPLPGRGRITTLIYLPPELARKTAEAIFALLKRDSFPFVIEVKDHD